MLFRTSKKKVQKMLLQMDNKIIDKVLDFNFLGIHFNEQLKTVVCGSVTAGLCDASSVLAK